MNRVIERVKKHERILKPKKCIVCKKPAEYSVKGLPNNCYCRKCAMDHFKYLNYLEKI